VGKLKHWYNYNISLALLNFRTHYCVLMAEWQAEHTERHLANVDGVTPRLSHRKLPADIDRYQLTEYRDKYCKVSSRTSVLSFSARLAYQVCCGSGRDQTVQTKTKDEDQDVRSV